MPQTNEGVLLVLGAIFIFVGVLGGGIKAIGFEIPFVTGRLPRVSFVVCGLVLWSVAIIQIMFPGGATGIATSPAPKTSQSTPLVVPTEDRDSSTISPTLAPTLQPDPSITPLPPDQPTVTVETPVTEPSPIAQSNPTAEPSEVSSVVEVNQSIDSSNRDNVTVTITQVEFLPTGRMRWHFLFANQSDENYDIRLNYDSTYLADEQGETYTKVADKVETPKNGHFTAPLQAGVRRAHWIEFDTPTNSVQEFTVVLISHSIVGTAYFPTTTVTLNYNPEAVSLPEVTPVPDDILTIPVDTTIDSSNRDDVTVTITQVEFLPNARMRWHFLFANQSDENYDIRLNYDSTYLADEQGETYTKVADKVETPKNDHFSAPLQAGVRRAHWIEFDTPTNSVQEFTVVLISHSIVGTAYFPSVSVTLPEQ
ncbi:MAG: hypothetical protein GFH23_1086650n124 [Chloroflexi bacterium AL-N1]|nr:hypothetical protein [Chloroflexi bacterium AL-N1]NOK76772.1 hypothetical protein [Chloroflexi bacterium AL-N5]NOK86512.1 hypothetical protein [Chloroflexi bacterium AL-N15]